MPDDKSSEMEWFRATRLIERGLRASSLVHELRQPLFAIQAQAQLGMHDEPATAERYTVILEQIRHIEALLRHYGEASPVPEPEVLFDLNGPVQDAVAMCAGLHQRAGVAVEVDLAPEALLVRGRELAARQVTINLLQNACDAASESEERRVFLRTGQWGDCVRLAVDDSGPGIPVALRPGLFQPFRTTKGDGQGTGLGLFVVQRLVQEAGAEVRMVDSSRGGARFEVDWPRAFYEDRDRSAGDLGFR
jgi:C4-dicarboxylate-specific signal transduction histidine kinase